MTDDLRARYWNDAIDDACRKVAGVSDYGRTVYAQAFRLGSWLRFDSRASASDAVAALLSAATGNDQSDDENALHVKRGLDKGRAEGTCPDVLTRFNDDGPRSIRDLRPASSPSGTRPVPTRSAPAKVPPDVASFWSHCRPFNDDPDVVSWLSSRCKVPRRRCPFWSTWSD